jgi:hypothetical protein
MVQGRTVTEAAEAAGVSVQRAREWGRRARARPSSASPSEARQLLPS